MAEPDLGGLLRVLDRHEVQYVVIGAQAVAIHGVPVITARSRSGPVPQDLTRDRNRRCAFSASTQRRASAAKEDPGSVGDPSTDKAIAPVITVVPSNATLTPTEALLPSSDDGPDLSTPARCSRAVRLLVHRGRRRDQGRAGHRDRDPENRQVGESLFHRYESRAPRNGARL